MPCALGGTRKPFLQPFWLQLALAMPPYIRVQFPLGVREDLYRLRRCEPYVVHGVHYNYRLYSRSWGRLRALKPSTRGTGRRMLKHPLMFNDGSVRYLDLHRVAALNYRACNPAPMYVGVVGVGDDDEAVHVHHRQPLGWRFSTIANMVVATAVEHQEMH